MVRFLHLRRLRLLTAEGADCTSLQPSHLESLILNFPGNIKVHWTSSSRKAPLDKLILPEFAGLSSYYVILWAHGSDDRGRGGREATFEKKIGLLAENS